MKIDSTPGKWHINKAGDGPVECNLICASSGNVLAEVRHAGIEWEEFEANSILINSIPELWAALRQIANPDQAALNASAYMLQQIAQEAIANVERREP